VHHDLGGQAKYSHPIKSHQLRVASRIAEDLSGIEVISTINLDDELESAAIEVDDIRRKRMLPPKSHSKLSHSKRIPKATL